MCEGEKESMSPAKPRELFVNITDKEGQCAVETDAGSSREPEG